MNSTHSIMFHHFHDEFHLPSQGSLSSQEFEEMLEWLEKRYNLLSAHDYLKKFESSSLQSRDICLSFDDSLLCQWDVAAPILDKKGLTAFFFVYSSIYSGEINYLEVFRFFRSSCFKEIEGFYQVFFNKVQADNIEKYKVAHDKYKELDHLAEFPFYSEDDKWFRYLRDFVLGKKRYNETMLKIIEDYGFDIEQASRKLWMSEDHLLKLHERGHLIGLHSYSHPTKISHLSFEQQRNEYDKNMAHLSRLIGADNICSMSHPCGDYNDDTLKILKEMNIKIGFRSSPDIEEIKSPFEVPRNDHANILKEMRL